MNYRAIATDLDGTLLRSDRTVSDRTREVIRAARDQGLLFVMVTGRPPRWIPPVIEQVGDHGMVICANGATLYDPSRGEIVARNDLAGDVALSIVDDVQSAVPQALFAVEQGFDFGADTAITETSYNILDLIPDVRIAPIRSFLDAPVTKLIIRLPHPAPAGAAARIQAIVEDRALVTHSTDESFLELSDPSVHKAATLEKFLAESGIGSDEVMAFGDMPNDLEMIAWAKLGFAMKNSHPDLQAVASHTTRFSNDEDGVAAEIERVLWTI